MKALLDTNILIHREASKIINEEIGTLFNWLDRLHYEKCIHPLSVEELKKHSDPEVVKTIQTKIKNYNTLKTEAPEIEAIKQIRNKYDRNENDSIDTSLLKEVYYSRVNYLITEDRKIHAKALELGISERVYTIDAFLEKVTAENPEFSEYKVLSVKKEYFGNIDVKDVFLDSFRAYYAEFEEWFNRKSDEIAYLCKSDKNEIVAFLYIKPEREDENYADIAPAMHPKKRLKIGTFKVISNGFKLGERFLKIIFDNALRFTVDEIYVTLFNYTLEQNRLFALLEDWGFRRYGVKRTNNGEEDVLIRNFFPHAEKADPCSTYPYISGSTKKFLVPIYPAYHTELFPDSILRTESPLDFVENKPNRNAIKKVYISRSFERDLESGDIIVFYRTASGGPAYYTSVTTTIGVVQNIITDIQSEEQFIEMCRKRSVFSDKELHDHWNYRRNNRPFVVNFLYVYTFPKRMNLKGLIDAGVIKSIEEAPRGFQRISDQQFRSILKGSNADRRFIIN
ncbi:hypothetical protein KA005_79465 [bacterium]|nr:hypothetical protein [bacterium]